MKKFLGRCSCGQVKYSIRKEPIFTHACHCQLCRRSTASAFVINSFIETANFAIESGEVIESPGSAGSGQDHKIHRCPNCYDQIISIYGNSSSLVLLKTSTLDDPSNFPPQAHIFVKRKAEWLELGGEIPQFEEYYDNEKLLSAESFARGKSVGW